MCQACSLSLVPFVSVRMAAESDQHAVITKGQLSAAVQHHDMYHHVYLRLGRKSAIKCCCITENDAGAARSLEGIFLVFLVFFFFSLRHPEENFLVICCILEL